MRNQRIIILLAFFPLILFLACQEDAPGSSVDELTQQQLDTIESFLTENGISATEDDRLFYYRALTENPNGTSPEVGDIVSFYYTISTLDGQLIDERKEGEGDPATKIAFGDGIVKVPVTLETIIAMMQEGEEYEFFLPSLRAYQDFSKPGLIPESAIIRMRIHIAEVLSPAEEKQVEDEQIQSYLTQQGLAGAEKLDSGVYYIQTGAGSGEEVANGKTIEVRYEGILLDSTVFDDNLDSSSPLQVTIGNNEVIPGFEIGLKQMQEGEKGVILIPSHVAYKGSATILPRSIIGDLLSSNRIDPRLGFAQVIPPFAILTFNVEVESVN